ncbi:MAG TPA: hypothetical protein VF618_01660 [Thermoanaerobaculia bacterium]
MADVKISIENGAITIDKDKVEVWVDRDKVTWKGNDAYTIEFEGGTYPNVVAKQQGTNNWVAEAGPFDKSGTTMKYDIVSGSTRLDPYIQVLP